MEEPAPVMKDNEFFSKLKCSTQLLTWLFVFTALMALFLGLAFSLPNLRPKKIEASKLAKVALSESVINGKDIETGLIAKGDYSIVKVTCTACHSSSVILNGRFSRQTWIEKIRWMQANQKLWDLGATEKPILDYLAKYYGPDSVQRSFRRPLLKDIKWYKLVD